MKNFTANNILEENISGAAGYFSKQRRSELVIVDPTVSDYQILLSGISPNVEVHILDSNRDGIEQITEILEERKEGRGERKENFFSLPPSSMAASPSSLSPLSSFLFLSTSSPTGHRAPST